MAFYTDMFGRRVEMPGSGGSQGGYNAPSYSGLQGQFAGQQTALGNILSAGYPYVPNSPYAGNYATLIGQLEQQAAGQGPSLAGEAFKRGSADAVNQQMAMARGGTNAGSARQAAMNIGGIQQGLAQGLAEARTGEQLAARQGLLAALGGAEGADFQRSGANQAAYLTVLAQQLGLSQAQMNALLQKAQIDAQTPSTFDKVLSTVGTVGGGLAAGGFFNPLMPK